MTRKRTRDEKEKAENKKIQVASSTATRADLARKTFLDSLLGRSVVSDDDTYCQLLENGLFPAHCPVSGTDDGIAQNDIYKLSGFAMSRAALKTWISGFKGKTTMPTCPMTRATIDDADLIALGFSVDDFSIARRQPTRQPQVIARRAPVSVPPVVVIFSDPNSLSVATDVDFCVALIKSFQQGRDSLTPELVARIKQNDDCFTLLMTFAMFHACSIVATPLWKALFALEPSFDWTRCFNCHYTESVQNIQLNRIRRRLPRSGTKLLSLQHVFVDLKRVRPNNGVLYALIDACYNIGKFSPTFKDLFRRVVGFIVEAFEEDENTVDVSSIGKLVELALEFHHPIGILVTKFYCGLRQQPNQVTLKQIWRCVARLDRLDQSSLLVAYLCPLPDDILFEFVKEAITNGSNSVATAYYSKLCGPQREADRFFCLKAAIDFSNSDFLDAHCLEFTKTTTSAHNNGVLMELAAENGEFNVIRAVFRGQCINVTSWSDMLVSISPLHFDSFKHLWSLGVITYTNSFSQPSFIDNLESCMLTLCRNGHVEKLQYWLDNSPKELLASYYQRMFLACCSSMQSFEVYNALYDRCKSIIKNFSIFFNNGRMIVRAATCGADKILGKMFSLLGRNNLPQRFSSALTEAIIASIKNERRKAFFVLWNYIGANNLAVPPLVQPELVAAARVCNDDYIKEALRIIEQPDVPLD